MTLHDPPFRVPRQHLGSLGLGGISADVRSSATLLARRHRFHILLLATLRRPFILLWSLLCGA